MLENQYSIASESTEHLGKITHLLISVLNEGFHDGQTLRSCVFLQMPPIFTAPCIWLKIEEAVEYTLKLEKDGMPSWACLSSLPAAAWN